MDTPKIGRVAGNLSEAGEEARLKREPSLESWAVELNDGASAFRTRTAEDAKARATHTARSHEERYEAEMHVRQMWRTMMGNTPGLAAEIAKMRATEQAKHRYREWELEWEQKHGRSPDHHMRSTQLTTVEVVEQAAPDMQRGSVVASPFLATYDWLIGHRSRPGFSVWRRGSSSTDE